MLSNAEKMRATATIVVPCLAALLGAALATPAAAVTSGCDVTNGTCTVRDEGGDPCVAELWINAPEGLQTVDTLGVCGSSNTYRIVIDPGATGTDTCIKDCGGETVECAGVSCGTFGNGCWAITGVTCNDPPECNDTDVAVEQTLCPDN